MCFNINFLKNFLIYAGYILFAIGVLSMLTSFVLLFVYLFDSNSQYNVKLIIGYFLFINGFILLICGILSYYGGQTKNRGVLCGYMCCGIWTFSTFLSFAIFSIALLTMHASQMSDPRTCQHTDWLRQAHRLTKKSSEILCRDNCTCNIENPDAYPSELINDLKYDVNEGAINIMGCEAFPEMMNRLNWKGEENHTEILTSLEVSFKCAGICEKNPYYLFSDVNNGPPESKFSCYEELSIFVEDVGVFLFATCWSIACILFLIAIATLCLCFHPNREDLQPYPYQEVSQRDNQQDQPNTQYYYVRPQNNQNNNQISQQQQIYYQPQYQQLQNNQQLQSNNMANPNQQQNNNISQPQMQQSQSNQLNQQQQLQIENQDQQDKLNKIQ